MSPTTTTGGRQFVPESNTSAFMNPLHHEHHHLNNTNLVLGPNQTNFQLHQQGASHHQELSPPEIGSTTTMWEDIASSIKKLDPDHADVLLVASCSSTTNALVAPNSTVPPPGGNHSQQNNFIVMSGEPPQMIVTTLPSSVDNSLMQEQQDCNNYVITSLANNSSSPMTLIAANVGSHSHQMGSTMLGDELSDNNYNINVSSMTSASATTNAFSSMSFDTTTQSTNADISSFQTQSSQGDRKDGIMSMQSAIAAHSPDQHSHQHIQELHSRHSQQQQLNNPSNPSAITSNSVSSTGYQQINPLIVNQNSHNHHHPPHLNQHPIQLQSNAIRSSHR